MITVTLNCVRVSGVKVSLEVSLGVKLFETGLHAQAYFAVWTPINQLLPFLMQRTNSMVSVVFSLSPLRNRDLFNEVPPQKSFWWRVY
jgi:hypothetical protein